jgi:hypothetical protein
MDRLQERMLDFVRWVGIDVRAAELTHETFLPGLDVERGALLVDAQRLSYPGDILHEAGHIAVAPAEQRAGNLEPSPADEMTAIAWSYAAACHLRIDPAIVFHADGYKGGSNSIMDAFTDGRYFGVPLLVWYGMAIEPKRAESGGSAPYPHMLRWVR